MESPKTSAATERQDLEVEMGMDKRPRRRGIRRYLGTGACGFAWPSGLSMKISQHFPRSTLERGWRLKWTISAVLCVKIADWETARLSIRTYGCN
jgi:hypothetical protein